MKKSTNYEILLQESNANILVIKDIGPWDEYLTITNGVEIVVKELMRSRILSPHQRLLYYDSNGDLDEIVHINGEFQGFRPFKDVEKRLAEMYNRYLRGEKVVRPTEMLSQQFMIYALEHLFAELASLNQGVQS